MALIRRIYFFFAGTTVKGAVDDLDLVIKALEECGFPHDRFYIHCDGALFGLMMPFVKRVCTLSNSFHCQIFFELYLIPGDARKRKC